MKELTLGLNKKNLSRAGLILLAGVVISWLILTLRPAPDVHPHRETPPHIAEVIAVEPVSRHIVINSQGTVTPKTAIDVTSQVSGQVVSVSEHFAAGGFFRAGEILLSLDPRDYEIALDQANAVLAEARKVFAQEQGQALQARREWRDLGNQAANDLFLRKPQLAAAEANVRAAEAGARQAQINLERTRISLPFDGRVVSVNANLGQYVNAGTVVSQVYASDIMEVRLPLSAREMYLLNLKAAAEPQEINPLDVKFRFRVGDKALQWPGKVVRIESSADVQSRLFYAVAEIHNPVEMEDKNKGERSIAALIPGVFVEADIVSNRYSDLVALPRTALYKSTQLMVLDGENRLQLQTVDVLQVDADSLVVRGLASGQLVLVQPPSFIDIGEVYDAVITTALETRQ